MLNYYNESGELSIEKETDINTLTNGLLAILNKDQKFKVGKNTIYYTQGAFYNIKDNESINNSYSKNNTSSLKKIGWASIETIKTIDSDQNNKKTILGSSARKGDYQREFPIKKHQPCGGALRNACCKLKYVNELYSRAFGVGYPNIITELYVEVKLEYNPSGNSWREASEYRNMSLDLSGNVASQYSNGVIINSQNVNINRNVPCVNRNQRFLLSSATYPSNL